MECKKVPMQLLPEKKLETGNLLSHWLLVKWAFFWGEQREEDGDYSPSLHQTTRETVPQIIWQYENFKLDQIFLRQ